MAPLITLVPVHLVGYALACRLGAPTPVAALFVQNLVMHKTSRDHKVSSWAVPVDHRVPIVAPYFAQAYNRRTALLFERDFIRKCRQQRDPPAQETLPAMEVVDDRILHDEMDVSNSGAVETS